MNDPISTRKGFRMRKVPAGFLTAICFGVFATSASPAYAAPGECRMVSLPDGASAMFCKDSSGKWRQQQGEVEMPAAAAPRADGYVQRAEATYQGTYDVMATVPPRRQQNCNLNNMLNCALSNAMNTENRRLTGPLAMHLNFNGGAVAGDDITPAGARGQGFSGTVSNNFCRVSGTNRNGSGYLMEGRCDSQGFSGKVTGLTEEGWKMTGTFTMAAAKYEDTSRKDAERAALQSQCDAGKSAACVALDHLK